jgi:hypothetical protein
MSAFKFECPQCQQHIETETANAGRQFQCPSCNHLIRVPPPPANAADYNPQSGMTWNTYIPGQATPKDKQ